MEKRFDILLIILFLLIIPNIEILSGGIMGKVTEEDVAVSIFIIGPPVLEIIKPTNGTYLINKNILLNYSVSPDADTTWYNIDLGTNNTITSPTYFNATDGISHTLYIYANNSEGTITKNVTFTVNKNSFKIIDDSFDDEEEDDNMGNQREDKKGESTDFFDYSYEELQNLSNIKFHEPNHGKIEFNEAINLTDDNNSSDNMCNISAYVNISQNRIEINSTELPNFNKSATLHLYGLTFSSPSILIDGSVCPDTICTQQSYAGGTLTFNVTQFTVYSAEETPAGEILPSGGRGSPSRRDFFSLDKEKVEVTLKQGETKEEQIIIKNLESRKIEVNLESERFTDFLRISEASFDLEPGESKIIYLNLEVSEDAIPDLYIGKLIVKSGSITKEILIALEVESQKPLFDVKMGIPERFLQVRPGEKIISSITLFNVGGGKEIVDVKIDYIIKNEEEEIIASDSETIAVKTQVTFIKEINTPENIIPGTYMIYIKTTYNGKIASASAWFTVSEEIIISTETWLLIIVTLVVFFILLGILIQIRKIKKHIKHYYKINEYTLAKEKLIKRGKTRKLKK